MSGGRIGWCRITGVFQTGEQMYIIYISGYSGGERESEALKYIGEKCSI